MSRLGQPDLKSQQLLEGYTIGDRPPYKVHLDGYDQSDLIMGIGPTKRKEFFYFTENTLHGVRYGDWKVLYKKQDKWFNGGQDNLTSPLRAYTKTDYAISIYAASANFTGSHNRLSIKRIDAI